MIVKNEYSIFIFHRMCRDDPHHLEPKLVDVVFDSGSKSVGIEIKSGMTIAGDFFANLFYWRKLHGQQPPTVLIYGGDRTFRQENTNVHAWWNF